MEEYTCMIPRETQEGAFYRAALALHQNHFQQAQAVSGNDLVFIDTTLYFYNYSNERLRYTVWQNNDYLPWVPDGIVFGKVCSWTIKRFLTERL